MEKLSSSGIYAIWCEVEGKCYVGGSLDILERKKKHLYKLRAGNHSNFGLQVAYNNHGESSFEFVVLEECSPELVISRERYWVAELRDLLYYPSSAGLTSGVPGVPLTEEIRGKISSSLTGQEKSLEHRLNLWRNRLGWRHSEETKKKISVGVLEAAKNGNRSGPPEGWKHSEESKEKMSKSRKGVPKSPEHRAKIAAAIREARRKKKWSSKKS